jgi:hypothetical protein
MNNNKTTFDDPTRGRQANKKVTFSESFEKLQQQNKARQLNKELRSNQNALAEEISLWKAANPLVDENPKVFDWKEIREQLKARDVFTDLTEAKLLNKWSHEFRRNHFNAFVLANSGWFHRKCAPGVANFALKVTLKQIFVGFS